MGSSHRASGISILLNNNNNTPVETGNGELRGHVDVLQSCFKGEGTHQVVLDLRCTASCRSIETKTLGVTNSVQSVKLIPHELDQYVGSRLLFLTKYDEASSSSAPTRRYAFSIEIPTDWPSSFEFHASQAALTALSVLSISSLTPHHRTYSMVTYTLEAALQLLEGEILVDTLAREVISSSTSSSSKIPAIQSFPLTETQIRDAPKLTKTISSEVIEAKVTFPCVVAVGDSLPIQLDIEKLTKKARNVKAKIKRYFYTGSAYCDSESETVLTHEFGTSLAANSITTLHLQLPIPGTWIPTVLERDHDKTNQPKRIRGRKTEVVLPNNVEALPREVLNVLPINMGVGYALSLSIDIAWSTDPKFDVPSGLFICTKQRNKTN